MNPNENIEVEDSDDSDDSDDSSELFPKISIIQKVKKLLKKKDAEIVIEKVAEESEETEETEETDFEESFNFYKKKWVISPFMNEIRKGDFEKIPIECMFSHYILFSRELHCYYIGLHNHESGDEFEIYDFDWVGENEEPEFKEISQTINARDCAKFLAESISYGYLIYIPEREEIDD